MKKCFVIQPFDKGKFDKRYEETFAVAIRKAKLEPYRIDNDPSVVTPIEDIHLQISNAEIIFAEITLDNPNVWYELGYAMALKKDIVMVCSDERSDEFPFDIRHRTIINYKTQAPSDFTKLEDEIAEKIKALIDKRTTLEKFETNPNIVKEGDGLSEVERFCLAIIIANQLTDIDSVDMYMLQEEMTKEGYTNLGTNMALRKLRSKNMIALESEVDYNNNEYSVARILENGEIWMFNHENEFVMKVDKITKLEEFIPIDDDDIPF